MFLLFDLEILLVYPYIVSAYTNAVYGLFIMLMFFIALTIGLGFGLGKKALNIDTRQNNSTQFNSEINRKSKVNTRPSVPLSLKDVLDKLHISTSAHLHRYYTNANIEKKIYIKI